MQLLPNFLRQTAASFFPAVLTCAAFFSTTLAASDSSAAQDPSGVENFHKVDSHVYRGAQPTDDGFRNLAKLGIQTVIDLREADQRSLAEEKTVTASGMRYVAIPMKGMQRPSEESMRKALDLLEDNSGPVFVHCKRGADRTGDVIACYRVEHDHWTNTSALSEARSLGMSWFQKSIQHYVLDYHPRMFEAPQVVVAASEKPAAAPVALPVAAVVHQ